MGLRAVLMIPDHVEERLALAVRQGVQSGKVIVLPTLPAQWFVARCFYPGCGESMIDCDFLHPYLWERYFAIHGEEPLHLGTERFP